MRWSRLALYSLYGVLAFFAIAIVAAFTIDFGRFKGNAETLVSDLLGREFVIDGPLHLTLGSNVKLSAEGIRLAGTDWSADPVLASVRSIEASVNTWSLFDWPIMIESLRVDGIRVNLEHSANPEPNEARENNWTFFTPSEEIEEEAEREERFKLPVLLADGRLTDSVLSYNNPDRPQPFRLTLDELTEVINDSDQVAVELSGKINDTAMALRATAGTVEDLINFTDLDFNLAGNLGEISFDGSAAVADLFNPARPTANLNLSGPNIEYLTDVLKLPRITSGPLELTTTISPVGEKMQLGLDGKFGEFTVLANGQFVNLRELENVELRVAAGGPDAGTVARLLGNDNVPQDPFNITGAIQKSGTRITVEDIQVTIGKTQFGVQGQIADFPSPNGASASVRIDGPDIGRFTRLLGLPGRLDGPFKLEADLVPLDGGGATVDVNVRAEGVELMVDGDVTDAPDLSGTKVNVQYKGANIQTITNALNISAAPAEPFNLNVNVERISSGIRMDGGSLSLGDDILTFSGLVGNKPLQSDTDVSFELVGPDLAQILGDFGRDADELPYAPYKLTGRVSRETDHFVLHDIVAAVGDSLEYQLTADGIVTDAPQLLGTRVRVGAHGVSIGAITDAAGVEGIPSVPFNLKATVELVQNGYQVEGGAVQFGDDNATVDGLVGRNPLAGDTSLEFGVNALDLQSTLASFGVEIAQLPSGEFTAKGEIRSRGEYFSIDDVTASLAGARAELTGRLGALPSMEGTDLDLRVFGDDLASLLPDDDALASLHKPYDVTSTVQLRDSTVRLAELQIQIDETEFSGEAEFSLEPMLDNGRITLTGKSPDLFVLSSQFAGIATQEKAPMDLNLAVHWADQLWSVDYLDLSLGKGTLKSSGSIDGPPNFDRTDFSFDWNISSLSNFNKLLGRELPDYPAHLKFRLVGTENVVTFESFEGVFGESDVSGDFSLEYGEIPKFDIGLTSNRLNLTPFLPPEPQHPEFVEPAKPPKKDKNARVIPDTPIPVEVLEKFLANVEIRINEMNVHEKTLQDIVVRGSVEDGLLVVEEFHMRNDRGGELSGRFGVRPLDAGAEMGMKLTGIGMSLGLPAFTKADAESLPRYEVNLAYITSGSTVREMAGNINGYIRVVGGEGRVKAGAMQIFTQDVLFQLLSTLNPFAATDPYTNLKCSAILATIEDGQLHGKPIMVIQSDKLNIFAHADVDLKTEKLLAEFETVPQKGIGISVSNLVNPYVNVTGTLAKPSIGLDPQSVLIEGGLAVVTVGISVLAKSFKDRFLSSKDPCGKAIAEADEDFKVLVEKYGRAGRVAEN